MNTQNDTRAYDGFKFIVAITFAIVALLLLLRSPKGALSAASGMGEGAASGVELPAFPPANFKWTFDEAEGLLRNPQGQALYRLDAKAGRWLPVVPDDLRARLPKGFQMGEVGGRWQITGPDGQLLYRWNPDTLTWEAVEAAQAGVAETAEAVETEVAMEWPELPAASFEWNLDKAEGLLRNPQGQPVYRLDADAGRWVPVVPDDLKAQLPEGFQVDMADGQWQITGPDGQALYRWNPDTLTWEAVETEAAMEWPEFPAASFEWNLDEAEGLLRNPQGQPVYRLDADAGRWEPVVPDDLKAQLPEGFQVVEVDGQWQITGPDGKALYRWNPDTLTWEAVETEAAGTMPSGDCAARPARLKVGDSAKVLTNLNLRSSPGIGDNWMLTMPGGTVVEVIGGPECVPHGDGAYRWWQVRLPDGTTGWAAEAPIHGEMYFLEPVK